MKNLLIVTATKSKTFEEFQTRPLFKSLNRLHDHYKNVPNCSMDYIIAPNNSDGLSKVYNQFITEENKNKIILFVHDDLEIEEIALIEKLNEAMEKFDIVGLAGSNEFKIGDRAWHLNQDGQWRDKDKLSGNVGHMIDGKFINSVYGEVPKRCIVMDGLFLGINVEKVLEKDWKFDESFNFNFYDLSSCLSANTKGLKLGTWNIPVIHRSGGGGENGYGSESWTKDAEKFIDICKSIYT